MNIAASITNLFFVVTVLVFNGIKNKDFVWTIFITVTFKIKSKKKPTYFCIRSKAASFQEAICKARSAKARLNYNEINESTY